jgi:hypothetical protein
MPTDFCPYCGEWGCDESCTADLDIDGEPCFACGTPGCPGYCDDYQTYNLRPDETGAET